MKKLVFIAMALLGSIFLSSCSSDIETVTVEQQKSDCLTFENSMNFKSVIDSVTAITNPIVRKGITRAETSAKQGLKIPTIMVKAKN